MSFLSDRERAAASEVNRAWHEVASEPQLWRSLDLSRMFQQVDNRLLASMLSQRRFRDIEVLNLADCSAVTSLDMIGACGTSKLKFLQLTHCDDIRDLSRAVPAMVARLPDLQFLELFGCTNDRDTIVRLVEDVRAVRPNIRLGCFWTQYCAAVGIECESGQPAECAHRDNIGQRGCWGEVRGRVLYSCTTFERPGNFPDEVVFACEHHREDDLVDDSIFNCHVCMKQFRFGSMWTEVVCRVCYDESYLSQKSSWIDLTQSSSISKFSFVDLARNVRSVADRKNLPRSLRSYGVVPCRLDFSFPDGEEVDEIKQELEAADAAVAVDDGNNNAGAAVVVDDENLMFLEERQEREALVQGDRENVPLRTFLANNRWRVNDQVSRVREMLGQARSHSATRALLRYTESHDVEVLADRQAMLPGRDGSEQMQLTLWAWRQALSIIYPIIAIMLTVLYFTSVLARQEADAAASGATGSATYGSMMAREREQAMTPQFALLLGGTMMLTTICSVYLIMRHREFCERMFRRFLVADIMLILVVGSGTLLLIFCEDMGIPLGLWTYLLLMWNFGVLGTYSLYYDVPPTLHRFYLVAINAIMAVLMSASMGMYFVSFFVTIAALGDIASEMRCTRVPLLSPFLFPTTVELLFDTPRILYQVGNLRIRAADLMWFGLLMGLVEPSLAAIVPAFVAVVAGLVLTVFVAPFFGKRSRPLPVAYFAMLVAGIVRTAAFSAFYRDFVLQESTLTFV